MNPNKQAFGTPDNYSQEYGEEKRKYHGGTVFDNGKLPGSPGMTLREYAIIHIAAAIAGRGAMPATDVAEETKYLIAAIFAIQ